MLRIPYIVDIFLFRTARSKKAPFSTENRAILDSPARLSKFAEITWYSVHIHIFMQLIQTHQLRRKTPISHTNHISIKININAQWFCACFPWISIIWNGEDLFLLVVKYWRLYHDEIYEKLPVKPDFQHNLFDHSERKQWTSLMEDFLNISLLHIAGVREDLCRELVTFDM